MKLEIGKIMLSISEKSVDPILEFFSIQGLNGYKNISINFEHSVKIIAAENGSGKTTLLNALNSMLTRKFYKLRQLDFEKILLKFRGEDEIVIEQSEFEFLKSEFSETSGTVVLSDYGFSEDDIVSAVEDFSTMSYAQFRHSHHFNRLYHEGPWDPDETYQQFGYAAESLDSFSDKLKEVSLLIQKAMGETRVMYLPTYRRIEAQLSDFGRGSKASRRGMRMNPNRKRRKSDDWNSGHSINYGLNDVQQKLDEITSDIKRGTASAYSTISGRTLEQLINTGDVYESLGDELNIQNLKVILARLGKSDNEERLAKLIETNEINSPDKKYLKSFLGQMLEIYKETQEQELAIEHFVGLVESYWAENIEEKHLTYDKLAVEVKLKNVHTGKLLSLNNLSSGEKQMISIFARLYLNPQVRYIILIDEPELSLSIEWQKKFLVDVFSSDSCAQLVAITHSPYIFENELDEYAGSLGVSFRQDSSI